MNKIELLRTFFRVSTAAFAFAESLQLAFNKIAAPSQMYQLHKMALIEIEKDEPNMVLIDKLLEQMENTAELNSKN